MRKMIEREITETIVKSGTVLIENGKPVIKNEVVDTFDGTLTDEKALKEIQKLHGKTSVVIEKTEVTERYEISVADFKKYATKKVLASPEVEEAKTE